MPVFWMLPSVKICCASVMRTPEPTASGAGLVVPMTLSNTARDSLNPTVFVFATLLPMTPSALLSASSPETPVYIEFNRDMISSAVYGLLSVVPTLTRSETGITIPLVRVNDGLVPPTDTPATIPRTFCDTATD